MKRFWLFGELWGALMVIWGLGERYFIGTREGIGPLEVGMFILIGSYMMYQFHKKNDPQ